MDFLFALLLSFFAAAFSAPVCPSRPNTCRPRFGRLRFFEIVLVAILYARGFIEYIPRASIGPAASLEFFFSLQGMLLALFLWTALSACSPPLPAVSRHHSALRRRMVWTSGAAFARRKKSNCAISDLVEPDGGDGLRISSCRTRKNWDKWLTVMYEEKAL